MQHYYIKSQSENVLSKWTHTDQKPCNVLQEWKNNQQLNLHQIQPVVHSTVQWITPAPRPTTRTTCMMTQSSTSSVTPTATLVLSSPVDPAQCGTKPCLTVCLPEFTPTIHQGLWRLWQGPVLCFDFWGVSPIFLYLNLAKCMLEFCTTYGYGYLLLVMRSISENVSQECVCLTCKEGRKTCPIEESVFTPELGLVT